MTIVQLVAVAGFGLFGGLPAWSQGGGGAPATGRRWLAVGNSVSA